MIAIDDAELSELITALPELESEIALELEGAGRVDGSPNSIELEGTGGLELETAGGMALDTRASSPAPQSASDELELASDDDLQIDASAIDDDALAEQILEIERTSEPGHTPDRSLFGSSENELTELPSQEIEFDEDYEPAEIVLGVEDDDEAPA
jgi:hypothetical protein